MANTKIRKSFFNIFDLIIVLLIIACITALVLRVTLQKKVTYDKKITIEYQVTSIMDVTATEIVNKVHENDTIYLQSNDEAIGYIESVKKVPNTIYVENDAGELESVVNPSKFNLEGTAVFYGIDGKDSFLINGSIEAKLYTVLYVYTSTSVFEMKIISIAK